jgi:uncharacterized glyoxalase superfamily protein PhnB
MIAYEDGIAALDWLARAFGFIEQRRMTAPDGRLAHGEMLAGEGLIMLATPTPAYEGPKRHRAHCDRAAEWSQAGANILSKPEDGPPGRRHRVEDIEGQRWMFMERSPA